MELSKKIFIPDGHYIISSEMRNEALHKSNKDYVRMALKDLMTVYKKQIGLRFYDECEFWKSIHYSFEIATLLLHTEAGFLNVLLDTANRSLISKKDAENMYTYALRYINNNRGQYKPGNYLILIAECQEMERSRRREMERIIRSTSNIAIV